jgi:hypothetical protein
VALLDDDRSPRSLATTVQHRSRRHPSAHELSVTGSVATDLDASSRWSPLALSAGLSRADLHRRRGDQRELVDGDETGAGGDDRRDGIDGRVGGVGA